jgi:hypothetical protein
MPGTLVRGILILFSRYEHDGDPGKQEKEDVHDFGNRHAGIMDRVECLSRNLKPLTMNSVDPVACKDEPGKPDSQQNHPAEKTPKEYSRNDIQVFLNIRLRAFHDCPLAVFFMIMVENPLSVHPFIAAARV